jgi:hypothetical protein
MQWKAGAGMATLDLNMRVRLQPGRTLEEWAPTSLRKHIPRRK